MSDLLIGCAGFIFLLKRPFISCSVVLGLRGGGV
jgi:hypothetical protein